MKCQKSTFDIPKENLMGKVKIFSSENLVREHSFEMN